jgi:serine/threonine protein kinase/tetratricopeptide (TPR) repeat protein
MNPIPPPSSEKTIFAQALTLTGAARGAYLDQACGSNSELRRGVEELLRTVNDVGFMAVPAAGIDLTKRAAKPPEETVGTFIGRYKLLQRIGEGGCGTVYMAEQEEPVRRRVALKVIKLGMDTKEVISRFEAERQALAMMDHPNIAKVLEAGATDTGRPFFAMELVRGVPITKYCDEQRLSTSARLGLFTQVCHAVQHAHQKGIIHRDLKPSNILVTLHDGVPVPKVIDFGIAKATHGRLTDNTLFTAFEQFIGTPAYMSPEQAEMSSLDIDTRSDIYSLGVLLYELLTGRTPFEGKELMQAGLDEMRRQIREVEPPRPSTRLGTLEKATLTAMAQHRHTDSQKLVSQVGGDLDWIVMRCLEKDRTRRYDTANSLADDIGRHLGNEPVTARPPSTAYRLGKAIRRNKIAFGAGAAIAASLTIGIIVSTAAYLKEKAANEFAVQTAADSQNIITSHWWKEIGEKDRLVDESRTNEKKAKFEEARSAYTFPLLKEILKGLAAGPLSADQKAQLLQPIDKTADRVSQDSAMPSEARNEVYDTLGDAFMKLGEFGRAERMFREMLALRRKLFGVMHPDTTAALDKLVEALKRQGKSAEAEAELKGAKVTQLEFLKTKDGGFYLYSHGWELVRQGKFAEGLASLEEAKGNKTPWAWGWGRYVVESDIAFARFQAGDFAGAKELASVELRAAREEQWWDVIHSKLMPVYVLADDNWAEYHLTKASLLLGRIALREGDLTAAKDYLLGAVNPSSHLFSSSNSGFQAMDLDLAYELLIAGERVTVIQFVDSVRKAEIAFGFGGKWANLFLTRGPGSSEVYGWEAGDREASVRFEQIRKDLSAGRVPDGWKKRLNPPPQATASVPLKPRPPMQGQSPILSGIRFFLSQLQFPLCIQAFGWVLAVPVLYRRPRGAGGLSNRAAAWLTAVGALSIGESALLLGLFWGTFGLALQVIFQAVCINAIFALAVWMALWEIRRALRGESSVGRLTLLLYLSLAYLVTFFLLNAVLTNRDGIASDIVYVMSGVATPLVLLIPIVIFLGVAWEFMKWAKRNAPLPPRAKLCLYVAAPILSAQVVAVIWPFLKSIDLISQPVALAALWLNVLLPWLLICGFVAARKKAEKPGITPVVAAP